MRKDDGPELWTFVDHFAAMGRAWAASVQPVNASMLPPPYPVRRDSFVLVHHHESLLRVGYYRMATSSKMIWLMETW
jgi:hypothetical protein